MLKRASVMRAASMIVAAAAIGHFVQNGDAIASRGGHDHAVPTPSLASGMPLPPMVMLQPSHLAVPQTELPSRVSVLDATETELPAPAAEVAPAKLDFACAADLAIRAERGAMMKVALSAPCNGGQAVEVEHAGLRFTMRIDETGALGFTMPALSPEALVRLTTADGALHEAAVEVPDARHYERAVLQWRGDAGFILTGTTGAEVLPLGVAEGAQGRRAVVHSLPVTESAPAEAQVPGIEARVTQANCGQEISAELLRAGRGQVAPAGALTVAVPGCDALGDILVLNNPAAGLKIAAN